MKFKFMNIFQWMVTGEPGVVLDNVTSAVGEAGKCASENVIIHLQNMEVLRVKEEKQMPVLVTNSTVQVSSKTR